MDEAQTRFGEEERTEAFHEPEADEGIVRTGFDHTLLWTGKVVCWLVFFAMAISVFEVVSRYGFDRPTSWVHESTVFLVAATFALGGPIALARDRHIRVRLVYDWVSPKTRRWLDVANNVIALGFCMGMSYAAYVMFWRSSHNPSGAWQLERSGTSWNPPFPSWVKGIILLALVLMSIQVVLHLVQAVRGRTPEGRR